MPEGLRAADGKPQIASGACQKFSFVSRGRGARRRLVRAHAPGLRRLAVALRARPRPRRQLDSRTLETFPAAPGRLDAEGTVLGPLHDRRLRRAVQAVPALAHGVQLVLGFARRRPVRVDVEEDDALVYRRLDDGFVLERSFLTRAVQPFVSLPVQPVQPRDLRRVEQALDIGHRHVDQRRHREERTEVLAVQAAPAAARAPLYNQFDDVVHLQIAALRAAHLINVHGAPYGVSQKTTSSSRKMNTCLNEPQHHKPQLVSSFWQLRCANPATTTNILGSVA